MKSPLFYLKTFLFVLILSNTQIFAQASGSIRYLDHLIPPQGGSYVAGCWGWTDTTAGREYALLGSQCGTSIVEITNIGSLVERDFIPGVCSSWRELQTYQHYAYVVSEGGGGVQIIDLSYLPDSAHLVKSFNYTQSGKSITYSHTNQIRDGYLYLNGCADWSPGGIVIFNLADPINPSYVGQWGGNYIHDCFVRNDTIYGAAIYGQGLQIINATNKANPQLLYTISYSGAGTHNAATTTDGNYALTTDEIGGTAKTLKIWSLTNPPTFTKVAEYVGSPTAIVHNVFVKGNLAVMSYYTAGIRVVDITDPTNPVEVGGYDSYPSSDAASYTGAWSTYPFFPSGKIIIGDMASGLYVVDINTTTPQSPTQVSGYSDYTTPNSFQLTWQDPQFFTNGDSLSNFDIRIYRGVSLVGQVDSGVQTFTESGLTFHQYYTYTVKAYNKATGDLSTGITVSGYAGGHPQSKPPSSFSVHDENNGVRLQWVNPSQQVDNTPLNDFAYVLIYRNGALIDSVGQTVADTGQVRTYTDTYIGYGWYKIRVKDNESPAYFSSFTDSLLAYGGTSSSYTENFETSLQNLFRTGTWDTTSQLSYSGSHCLTDTRIGNYENYSNTYFLTPPVILTNNPVLRFAHIGIVFPLDSAKVEISNNSRASFTLLKNYYSYSYPQWQDGSASANDWVKETFDLNSYAGDTVVLRFRLKTNISTVYDGWYLDDIFVGPSDNSTTFSFSANANWNLLSLPVIPPEKVVSSVFPSATSFAFEYQNGYHSTDSFVVGKGYWLQFDSSEALSLNGGMILRDTIEVNQRWNIIGSLSEPIDTSKIKTIPSGILQSPFYGFDGAYAPSKTIEPGKGYWVKVTQAGKIILSVYTAKNSATSISSERKLDKLNSLTLSDKSGHSQKLYFGNSTQHQIATEYFEMPPVPPAGAFDVRFRSHRFAELAGGTETTFPIMLQSVEYPLTLEWNIQAKESGDWFLTTDANQIALKNSGTASLQSNNLQLHYTEGNPSSPLTTYALHQNFPNPFNPKTVFKYQLPDAGWMSLKIYNMLGEEVATIVDGMTDAGLKTVEWTAEGIPSGMYYVRMVAGEFSEMRKIVLLK